jgi:hypothetical protein
MVTLTVIPYKPPQHTIGKPSPKHVALQPNSIKNVRFKFTDGSIEKSQTLGRATGGSNLQQKVAGDIKAMVKDAQASGHNLARIQGMCSD